MGNRKHLSQNLNPQFNYYLYVYLNVLKPGKFVFKKFTFDYEPFYIGLGKGNRINAHIKEAKDLETYETEKIKIIRKILRKRKEPIRYKLYEKLTIESANRLEKCWIKLIGRQNLNNGSLTNLDNGGMHSSLVWMKAQQYLIYGEGYNLSPKLSCLSCDSEANLLKEKGNFLYEKNFYKVISFYYKCHKCKTEFTTTNTDSSLFFQARNLKKFPNYKSDDWIKLYKKR